jgi:hypothetical protein
MIKSMREVSSSPSALKPVQVCFGPYGLDWTPGRLFPRATRLVYESRKVKEGLSRGFLEVMFLYPSSSQGESECVSDADGIFLTEIAEQDHRRAIRIMLAGLDLGDKLVDGSADQEAAVGTRLEANMVVVGTDGVHECAAVVSVLEA